jgi:hypothetical protein
MSEDKEVRAVQKTASLHERAVKAIAEGKVQTTPRKPRKAPSRPVRTPLDYHHEPHPMALAAAKAIVADPENTYTTYRANADGDVIVR